MSLYQKFLSLFYFKIESKDKILAFEHKPTCKGGGRKSQPKFVNITIPPQIQFLTPILLKLDISSVDLI